MNGARLVVLILLIDCAAAPRPFALREPFTQDTDLHPVSVPCHPDPSPKEPKRVACAPRPYVSWHMWDMIDNLTFARLGRGLSVDVHGEATNTNSLDEVPDSAWFDNRIGARRLTADELTAAGCQPEDSLQSEIGRTWVIDKGKENGSSLGFRVVVPDKGTYLLKSDSRKQPERNTAASIIGAALYHAAGFATTCEQIVYIERPQLVLSPHLEVISYGTRYPFDEKALLHVLDEASHRGAKSRMQASKWLSGYTLGPFRYEGTRPDDPNDVIPHEDRRELRGSRLLAAWMNHWDSKELNTMDVWVAKDPHAPRSSPGYVRHYILDTSDSFGQYMDPTATRAGTSYGVDLADMLVDFATLGIRERPWDRARLTPGHERFGYFSTRDFDPEDWVGAYPNPAFLQMTERDAAWMARIIARFSVDDIHTIVAAGQFTDPRETDYLTRVMVERQHQILARYLTRLSPIADVHREADGRLCAVDLARLRNVVPADRFHYSAVEQTAATTISLPVSTGLDGAVCVMPRPLAAASLAEGAPGRRVTIRLADGVAGPLEIHTYDLGARGHQVVGLTRPPP